jgi:hypothetical protein
MLRLPGRLRVPMSASRGAFLAGVAVTIALILLLTRGALAPGYLLYRDFVTVPVPVLNAAAFGAGGAPRSVPLDLVTALAAIVAPSWLVQKILLVAPLLLAGSGASFLLRHRGPAATIVASVLAVWNPYVAQRLLLGQAPTLLGYAMIPWLIAAVRSPRSRGRRIAMVSLAALPAVLTPVGGLMALLTVVVAAASLPAGRRLRDAVWLGLPVLVLCLPWVVVGLRDPTRGAVPSGATAFAVAADSPAGVVGSVLTLGGVWAPGAWLASRAAWPALLAELVLVVVAICGWRLLRRGRRLRRPADLGLAAYVLGVLAVLAVAGPGLPLWRSLQQVPGVAMLRDTHRLLGFAAMSVALLCGIAASEAVSAWGHRGRPGAGLSPAAGVLALVGIGLLSAPDLAARLDTELRPVPFPGQWTRVVEAVNGSAADGSVLILPWQPFRQTPWAGRRPFLDPLPRALDKAVVSARDLLVTRDGRSIWVGGEDLPAAPRWRRGEIEGAELRRLGVRWVVEWLDSPGALPKEHPGMTRVLDGAHWRVWRVG